MAIHNVATNSELLAAFDSAAGGDEIVGAAGANLGILSRSGKNFSGGYVRFLSADPGNRCTITGLYFNNCSYIDIDGVDLEYTWQSGDNQNTTPFQISNSHHMKLRNSKRTGSDSDATGYGDGFGFRWIGVDDFVEEDNYVTGFRKASDHYNCQRGSIKRNEFDKVRSDAMNFAQVLDLDIENNYIHDHRPDPNSSDHCDGIQFQSNGLVVPCERINIRHNRIDIGDGGWTQGIFIRNEAIAVNGGGAALVYRDFLIEENLIYGRHSHGIAVDHTVNLTVQNNTLLQGVDNQALVHNQNPINNTTQPYINISGSFSSNVVVRDNVSAGVVGVTAGVTKTNNRTIAPDQGDVYTADFENIKIASGSQFSPVANAWTVKAGGQVAATGAGVTDMAAPGTGGGSGPVPGTTPPPTLAAVNVPVNISVN